MVSTIACRPGLLRLKPARTQKAKFPAQCIAPQRSRKLKGGGLDQADGAKLGKTRRVGAISVIA
jgi:hypothetical protein